MNEQIADLRTLGNGRRIYWMQSSILAVANGRPFGSVKQETSYNSGKGPLIFSEIAKLKTFRVQRRPVW